MEGSGGRKDRLSDYPWFHLFYDNSALLGRAKILISEIKKNALHYIIVDLLETDKTSSSKHSKKP